MTDTLHQPDSQLDNDWIPLKTADPFLSEDLRCIGVGHQQIPARQPILDLSTHLLQENLSQDYMILTVQSGSCNVFSDTLSLLNSGDVMIFPPHSRPEFLPSEQICEFCFVFLGGNLAERYLNRVIQLFGTILSMGSRQTLSEEILQMIHSFYLGIALDDCYCSLFAYKLLMNLYQFCGENGQPRYPQLVHSALQIIRENFAYLYGIDEVAEDLGVSKSHFIREFSKFVGVSPGKYLTQIRVENAKLFLISGEYSVETVANMTGYSDSNYFCKVFKKQTGTTPKQFADHHMKAPKPFSKQLDKAEGYLY